MNEKYKIEVREIKVSTPTSAPALARQRASARLFRFCRKSERCLAAAPRGADGADARTQTLAKGWNWGEAEFRGNSMAFVCEEQEAFEVPLKQARAFLSPASKPGLWPWRGRCSWGRDGWPLAPDPRLVAAGNERDREQERGRDGVLGRRRRRRDALPATAYRAQREVSFACRVLA